MQEQQARLAQTQMQLATGMRLTTPADDPAAAVRILELKERIDTTNQYLDNTSLATARLQLEESTLSQVTSNLQRFRELVLQGNNDSNDHISRMAIAGEMRQLLDAMVGMANSRDANGEYVFAGTMTQTEPFAATAAGYTYSGDSQQHLVQISPQTQIADGDPGDAVFMNIPDGNGTFSVTATAGNSGSGVIDAGSVTDITAYVEDTYTITFLTADTYEVRDSALALVTSGAYTEGEAITFNGIETDITGEPAAGDTFTIEPSVNQSLMDTYQNLIDVMESAQFTPANTAEFHNAINHEFAALDQALEHIIQVRSPVGSRLNAADSQQTIQQDLVLGWQAALSEIQDLDWAEAISRFQIQNIALQAAQQSFASIQSLSLFNFLR